MSNSKVVLQKIQWISVTVPLDTHVKVCTNIISDRLNNINHAVISNPNFNHWSVLCLSFTVASFFLPMFYRFSFPWNVFGSYLFQLIRCLYSCRWQRWYQEINELNVVTLLVASAMYVFNFVAVLIICNLEFEKSFHFLDFSQIFMHKIWQ